MFKSKRVPCFLNTFSGHGDDTDNKELKLVFHISGISPELAAEISPQLADRLFRPGIEGFEAAREISKVSFSSIAIPMQNTEFYELPEGEDSSQVMVPSVAVSNLRASREGSMFRLEFDSVVPMDGITMRLVEKYYKSTCFLTMEKAQIELKLDEDPIISIETEDTQDLLQDAADGKSAAAGPDEEETGAFINSRAKTRKGKAAEKVH